jgi:hypothetical protein
VINKAVSFFFLLAQQPPLGQYLLIHEILDHTQRRTTVSRTPLDEESVRRSDLYLATHNTRQTYRPPVGFELTISAGERPHAYALDRAATGTGKTVSRMVYCRCKCLLSGHRPLSNIYIYIYIYMYVYIEHRHRTGTYLFSSRKSVGGNF